MQGELKVFHKIRFGSFLSVVCFISASCGTADLGKSGDTSASNTASQGSSTMFVTSQGNLPLCETAKEGQLVYVNDDKSFYTCSKLAWIKVEIKGDKGDPGSQGVAGTAGKDGVVGAVGAKGTDGQTNKIASSIDCIGYSSTVSSVYRTLNGKTVPTNLSIFYSASVMTNGDVFATAQLNDGGASYGGSSFYSMQQIGAETASVLFNYDTISPFSNGGWWQISVNRTTGVAKIRYSDDDFAQAPNYLEWEFMPSACTKQTYN